MNPRTARRELLIHQPGTLTLVQDLGRTGHASLGVPPSGAADPPALKLANRLVGNPENTAGLEITLGGLIAEFTAGHWLALTGAELHARLDDTPLAANAPHYARPGQMLRLERPLGRGLRTYLAISGGIDIPPVLGSRSTDLMSGLGPPPLRSGTKLPLGPSTAATLNVDIAPVPGPAPAPTLDIVPGPRDDWFTPGAMTMLTSADYAVTSEANRIGIRLRGPALPRRITTELPSEPMMTGALQVPPTGLPILFLNDHPTTGGYPVIAVVTTASLPAAAQLVPGDTLHFRLARPKIAPKPESPPKGTRRK
ncbi:biotin-dependent carboxyltransferase [Actinomadura sp. KC216]|uniref:5-oxoprolinase subunit C family protein n=1 Tax=Actinomadura sp. KC216 TaxID=2530370 RepID=UPI001051F062|nr:biotin-dependent carboxyltransferase family protein [Actinomadura sp. KC216]TDB91091.1 biotin-dependent carboxyltransferase [Actinomadura sp. KC216]